MRGMATYCPQSFVSATSLSVWSRFGLLDAIKITPTVLAGRGSMQRSKSFADDVLILELS